MEQEKRMLEGVGVFLPPVCSLALLAKIHERQVESYLKSTGMSDGLLVNFGNLRRLEWRVYSP